MFSRRNFLGAGVSLGMLALAAPALGRSTSSNDPVFRAGAGRATISLSDLFPIDDFTGQHDPLSIRVLLTEKGLDKQAIVVVDITSLTNTVITKMKSVVTEITGVNASCIMVSASHSFSTPHLFIDDSQKPCTQLLFQAFIQALTRAAQHANDTLQPAIIGSGSGVSHIAVNRDVLTPFGWWLGADDAGFTDPTVGVITVNTLSHKPIAVLVNYAVQPAVMDASQTETGGRLISADLAGAVSHYIERHFNDDAVAFYLVGCAGDQAPYFQASRHLVYGNGTAGRQDIHEKGFLLLELLGQKLGEEVVNITQNIKIDSFDNFRVVRHQIMLKGIKFTPHNAVVGPVSTFHYVSSQPIAFPITLIQWGDIIIVGVQPELSAIFGERIRNASPFTQTFVVTMVDGAAKYLPDISGYQRFTYEARSSPFAPGEGEHAVQRIITLLTELRALPA